MDPLLLFRVAFGDEGKLAGFRGKRLAAHHEGERRAGRGVFRRDVAHGDRRIDAGAEAARRDRADLLALVVQHFGAFAGRRAAFGPDAGQLAADAVSELLLYDRRAGKAAFLAAALRDRPVESGLDRRRRGVDVVAVQAEAGLEAQGIARAESDRLHFRLAQQPAGEVLGL